MCGLCGVVYTDPERPVDRGVLLAMRDVMYHRGPDDAGLFTAPGIGLGCRRLAILDLSERGHMPMATIDGRFHLVYNGEVYNAAEFRPWLEQQGFRFCSTTDTEVLLYLYATLGPAMLDRLNGMFALAVWDAAERTLFLARDRLGVKPLYYVADHASLRFASEAKALFAAGVAARLDPTIWSELLCFRYVAGERTPFADVLRLLPGHYLLWKDGAIRVRRWWSLADRARALQSMASSASSPPAEWFAATFDDAVRLRRISDVPVGVMLSGGLDSGSVAASLAAQGGRGTASVTVRFEDPSVDEGPLARTVARRWGLTEHELVVRQDELPALLLRASWLNDEPLAHGNEPHILALSEFAKPRVTVLLSGEGADETLGGYVRYRPLHYPRTIEWAEKVARRLPPGLPLRGRWRKLCRLLATDQRDGAVLYNACDVLPTDLAGLGLETGAAPEYRLRVLAEARQVWPDEPVRQAMYLDQHTFLCSLLDRNDRMTMGASIECRVPFLDYRLVERLAALPTDSLMPRALPKALLRNGLGGRLPREVLAGRKWGFGVPWGSYLRHNAVLRGWVEAMPRSAPIADAPFEPRALAQWLRAFLAGDRTRDALVRHLAVVTAWHQAFFQGTGSKPAPTQA